MSRHWKDTYTWWVVVAVVAAVLLFLCLCHCLFCFVTKHRWSCVYDSIIVYFKFHGMALLSHSRKIYTHTSHAHVGILFDRHISTMHNNVEKHFFLFIQLIYFSPIFSHSFQRHNSSDWRMRLSNSNYYVNIILLVWHRDKRRQKETQIRWLNCLLFNGDTS